MKTLYVSAVLALMMVCSIKAGTGSVGGWHLIGDDTGAFLSSGTSNAILDGAEMMAMGAAAYPEMESTENIRLQAQALGNDPIRIFEFVRNHIGFELYFGCIKGAEATLLSGYGNDLDQCALLGALLRAADDSIQIKYIQGNVVYTGGFLSNLFKLPEEGLGQLNPWFLMNAPVQRVDGWEVDKHYWLKARIDGVWYEFDPAYVPHEEHLPNAEGVLQGMSGYDRQSLLLSASEGATSFGVNQVKDVNAEAVAEEFGEYVESLFDTGNIQEVLAGLTRQPEPIQAFYDQLPVGSPPDMVRVVSSIELDTLSESLFGGLRIKVDGEWDSGAAIRGCELSGHRLTLFHDAANYNRPVLRLDGDEIYRGQWYYNIGSAYNLDLSVSLPTGWGATYEHTETVQLGVGSSYSVVMDFLVSSPKVLARESNSLSKYRDQGLSDDSEAILGTTLHIMGLTYTRQNTLQNKLLGRMAGIPALGTYQCGVVAQETGYYIDLPLTGISYAKGMDGASAFFKSTSFIASALEHSMLEQVVSSDIPGISSTKGIVLNNAVGKATYYANSGNWTSGLNVRGRLTGYTPTQLASLDVSIGNGYDLLVPESPVSAGEWSGVTYFGVKDHSLAAIIAGEYGIQNGGYSTFQGFVPPPAVNTVTRATYIPPPPPALLKPRPKSYDPVDLYSGDLLFDNMDLSIDGPVPLVLERHYNSGQTTTKDVMGHGWRHSLQVELQEHSNGDSAFGERGALDATAVLVAQMVALDMMKHESNARGWLVSAIAANWATDAIIGNSVTIHTGNSAMLFTRLPGDLFVPPPGSTDILEEMNDLYLLKEQHGNVYEFGANGRLSKIVDQYGFDAEFIYDSETNLQTVTTYRGGWGGGVNSMAQFSFGYANGLLSSVADNTGRTNTYQYDSNSNLTNYNDAGGFDWGYGYDDAHRVKWMQDPEGITTIQNQYNERGQVDSQISASGHPWSFSVSDYRSTEIDPLGNETVYYFDKAGYTWCVERADGSRNYTIRDEQGRVVKTINANGVNNAYVYDANHNLLIETNALGTSEQVVSAYGYDAENHLRFVTNALGTAEQRITEYTYTAEHDVDTVIHAKGTAMETVVNYDYRSKNQLELKSEGNGRRITTYSYDYHTGTLDAIASTDAGEIGLLHNLRDELLTRVDARGARTEYEYDANSRLITTLYDDTTTSSNSYWKNGLLKTKKDQREQTTRYYWTQAYKIAGIVFPDGGCTTNIYDAADRLVMMRDAEENWTTNVLDAVGRTVAFSSASTMVSNVYDAVGNATKSIVDPEGWNLWTKRTYDSLNRLSSTQTSVGTQHYAYDALGRQTNFIDASENLWATQYDDLGRVHKSYRPSVKFEEYGYDALGNRTHFWNAEREMMSFGYNAQGQMTSSTNALEKVRRYIYDDNGNLTKAFDGRNASTTYQHDSMNRLISDSTGDYYYDSGGNLTGFNGGDNVRVGLAYDDMNRIISCAQTNPVSVPSMVLYGYNKVGKCTNMVYPGGLSVDYTYGADNRVVGVTTTYTNGSTSFQFGYDTASRPTWTGYPNGIYSSFEYDAENQVVGFRHGSFGNYTIVREMDRDARGYKMSEEYVVGLEPLIIEGQQLVDNNVADQVEHIDQRDTWLGGELNQWYERDFSYDGNGNLINESISRPFWNTNPAIKEYSIGYVWLPNKGWLNGIVRQEEGENDLVFTIHYHDAFGARIGQKIDNTAVAGHFKRYYILDYSDGMQRPLAETDASGSVTRYYVWSGSQLLCHIEADGTTRYYHADELGSTIALTDEAGNVTDEFAYTPYGKVCNRTGTTSTPFQWLGGFGVFYDDTFDIHYTKHRLYSSSLRRFLQPDPLGIDGGVNLYAMANMNPLFFIDPYGLCAESAGVSRKSFNSLSGKTYLSADRSGQALAGTPLMVGSNWSAYDDFAYEAGVQNWLGVLAAPGEAIVGEWALGKIAGAFTKVPKRTTTLTKYEPWPNVPASPHTDGFLFGSRQIEVAQTGQIFSRLGKTSGNYVAPPGTSLSARGLPTGYQGSESLWKVVKPFSMESGLSAPWQGSTGMGIQHKLPQSIDSLWKSGYLSPVN